MLCTLLYRVLYVCPFHLFVSINLVVCLFYSLLCPKAVQKEKDEEEKKRKQLEAQATRRAAQAAEQARKEAEDAAAEVYKNIARYIVIKRSIIFS